MNRGVCVESATLVKSLKLGIKWILYPGMNLHARLRYRQIPLLFGASPRDGKGYRVLDAGSGNGMLAYSHYLKGNRVLGLSFNNSEVQRCKELFNGYLAIPESRLEFRVANLYDLEELGNGEFREIVCSETLEHIRGDDLICRGFWRLLEPGGVLHLCAPNADHPYNKGFPLDPDEKGGHVRPGYTERIYRELLEPLGFRIECIVGLGGAIRQAFNWRIKEVQKRYGAAAGLPLFAVALVAIPFGSDDINPSTPFSIYAKAIKPLESD